MVACTVDAVDVAVEFEVLFPAAVVVGRPERISCEFVVDVLDALDEFPATKVLYPKMVLDPTVEVRTVDPVVIREMTGTVLSADDDTVRVEA